MLPAGCEHLLAMSAGPERVKALEIACLIADESYNRGSERALRTIGYTLATTDPRSDKQTMTQLLHKADAVPLLLYGRAFWVGFNGGRFEEGLSNRLARNTNYVSLPPTTTLAYVERGIKAGHEHREQLERARRAQEELAAKKKAPKPDGSKDKRVASNKKSKAR